MFAASHPFAFFDYFRTPYELRPPGAPNGPVGAAAFVRTLTVAASPGGHPRSLMWIGADARPATSSAAGQPGCYQLDGFTFFGHVTADAAVRAMLPQPGRGWHPAEHIRAADGRRVAAIWRDTDGNVFLPFDPAEVMRLYWSERYREIGRSGVAALGRAAALRGYYLARPAMPRSVQLALRRLFTRVQAASSFPGWPIEDSLHDFYDWLFAVIAELAGRPVPFLGLWPDGRSWALVLTHDVETAVGYSEMDLLRGPERARGYRSSWNFVGDRYEVDDETVRSLQDEGCEIGVHGLRHDGRDLSGRLIDERLPAMFESLDKGIRHFRLHQEEAVAYISENLDYTAAQVVRELQQDLAVRGVAMVFAHVQSDLRPDLDRHHLTEVIGPNRIFDTLHEALHAYHNLANV